MVTKAGGTAVVAMAWGYVAMRYVHAIVHLGSNRVRHRLRAYFASWLLLIAMWICIAVTVATRPA
jgi:hypothetical protein